MPRVPIRPGVSWPCAEYRHKLEKELGGTADHQISDKEVSISCTYKQILETVCLIRGRKSVQNFGPQHASTFTFPVQFKASLQSHPSSVVRMKPFSGSLLFDSKG